MRALLAVLLLLTLAFAGCTSKGGGGDDDDPTGTSTPTGSGTGSGSATGSSSGTSTGAQSANRQPVANLTASLSGGPAPLLVNFTVNATDADGDALNWTVSFGDGSTNQTGSQVPVVINHTFAAAGKFNVTLVVTDGKLAANDTVAIAVTSNATGPPVVLTGETSVPGSPATSSALGAMGCAGFVAGESGLDCVIFELDTTYEARAYTIVATAGNPDVEFWGSCDADSDSKISGGELADDAMASTIPVGARCAILWFYSAGATGSFTMTIV